MAERRFTRALSKPGSAAQLRETVSQAVRESTSLAKPHLVEPLDYEYFISKNKTILQNDPQREMLLYPPDDVTQSVLPRRYRTTVASVPSSASTEASSLFVQECVKNYTCSWHVVHYKYSAYSGSYLQLPRLPRRDDELEDQVYEVDAETDANDGVSLASCGGVIKEGYLLKGPDSGSDNFIVSIATKSFKRRHVCLRQEVDGTYILELHKDERKSDTKGSICMEFCQEVIRNMKRSKLSFELKMQDGHKSVVFAAESESELEDWLDKLHKVVSNSKLEETRSIVSEHRDSPPPPPESWGTGTLRSLETSKNPELMKYAKETDYSIAAARQENRQKLFAIYPDMPKDSSQLAAADLEPEVEPYKEQFGIRFMVKCEGIHFKLQAHAEIEREGLCQVEPYFMTMAVYDAKRGRKLTEDFQFDVNSPSIRAMFVKPRKKSNDNVPSHLADVSEDWLAFPKQAIFSVPNLDSEIYLVIRIEKILQGSISQAAEPYIKDGGWQSAEKMQKYAKMCCQRLGHYRMPFAWSARPIFKPFSKEIDTYSGFTTIFKQDGSKLSDQDLLKMLGDFKKPEKMNRIPVIPGSIKVTVQPYDRVVSNSLTTCLLPVRPFPVPPTHEPTFEIKEFSTDNVQDSNPHTTLINHLYVHPKSLKYDMQKTFAKARNIAVVIELRSSDTEGSMPIKCIYGRPGESLFVTQASCAVLHHSTMPEFYNEAKLVLPTQIHEKHHLLFTFYHVSCAPKTRKDNQPIESPVGYVWVPLLSKGRLNVEEQCLPVASQLSPGYLSCEPLGWGKGFTGPDVRWVDNQKQLFTVDFQLVSTVYTKDQHLHHFFDNIQKLYDSRVPGSDADTCKSVKALHAVDICTVVQFLPTLLNQLFRLLVTTMSEEVELNVVRVLIHFIHEIHEAKKADVLHSFIKYAFNARDAMGHQNNKVTIHEELAKSLTTTLRPANTDFLVINKFLQHSWFFFQVLVKSMAQYLLSTGRIKMQRHERFSADYQFRITTLVQGLVPHITQKYRELPVETSQANHSLAHFIKKCLTFMDRGFAFKLINLYMDKFSPGDPKVLQEYKFEFLRIVSSHEHYVALNLPLVRFSVTRAVGMKSIKELEQEYTLNEEFCKQHFLVGLLLQELRTALGEPKDVRQVAIAVLRNLLAKHSFDDRYQNKAQKARIAALYLPFIPILLDNINRLVVSQDTTTPVPAPTSALASPVVQSPARNTQVPLRSSNSATGTPVTVPRFGMHRYTIGPDSSYLHSRHNRDSAYFNLIAGPVPATSSSLLNGSSSSLNSDATSTLSNASQERDSELADVLSSMDGKGKDKVDGHQKGHSRSQSVPFVGSPGPVRFDKFETSEVKDLLVCFLYIVKNISEEVLIGWWQHCTEYELLDFFQILTICLHQFRYVGKKQIANSSRLLGGASPAHTAKAMTLPARMAPPNFSNRSVSMCSETAATTPVTPAPVNDADSVLRALLEANIASEVGLITLDLLGIYCLHFKDQLVMNTGDNMLMRKVFDIYVSFLQVGQSEKLLRHVFAALRSFINKYPAVLFDGNALLCGKLCYELLKCCNSRLSMNRHEACAILYLLMRSNYDYTGKKNMTRVHLQVIISVSQLLGEVIGLNNSRFQESLAVINNFASSDRGIQNTRFPSEVKDLTKRIRTVLMATTQMREHETDQEMLIDLQHSLANSYSATPELRKTWLESMARIHACNGDLSEAAHCFIHIAALIAEYLKHKEMFEPGCQSFEKAFPNVVTDEGFQKDDSGMQDIHYTEDTLIELLENCASALEKAERYELIADVYKILIPVYERRRDYKSLAQCYETLHHAYSKIMEVNRSGRRLLGKFYRVAFFGQPYFEEESGKEYIYKEPKVTSLPEISERLYHLFCEKFGQESIKMIMDSNQVDQKELDPKFAYIQVTHVTPYFDDQELLSRPVEFDRNNNISRFMYETPFTLDGRRARGSLEEQCKRRTILTTNHAFPYLKKRIPVASRQLVELSPIEVAIDEMRTRVAEITEVVTIQPTDLKKLQLKLQGSISVQVNAGPMAYATTFLKAANATKYPDDKVEELKYVYREFVKVCQRALDINGRLIASDQYEYHDALRTNFQEFVTELANILQERLVPDEKRNSLNRNSLALFNCISATPGTSTV